MEQLIVTATVMDRITRDTLVLSDSLVTWSINITFGTLKFGRSDVFLLEGPCLAAGRSLSTSAVTPLTTG